MAKICLGNEDVDFKREETANERPNLKSKTVLCNHYDIQEKVFDFNASSPFWTVRSCTIFC